MKRHQFITLMLLMLLSACAFNNDKTLADLQSQEVVVKDVKIEDGLEKAMQGYQKFLDETPESAMTPEAIRRLADLNIEKEYGVIATPIEKTESAAANLSAPEQEGGKQTETAAVNHETGKTSAAIAKLDPGSSAALEKRASQQKITPSTSEPLAPLADGTSVEDLQTAGAEKAIALYLKLLKKFPAYERNDQVLYQLSRAYEETGKIEEAMKVMNRLISEYPNSRHIAEVQFRRAEYFFTRKKYLDAEDAYKSILDIGKGTEFYELALFKRGWTFYKQDLYEDALLHFTALLDHKVSAGYDFEQLTDENEKKHMDDTFHVISLSFSSMGGADAISDYFNKHGSKSYESNIYSYLGEFFLTKRRYSDAAQSYKAFADKNPYHKVSPHFNMRVIDIYHQGRFPLLVVEAKKDYSLTYGLKAEYWKHFNIAEHADVVDNLKKNIIDLAAFYHALYQDVRYRKNKEENFYDASHWYKEFLVSFPKEDQSPGINHQLADLLLENKDYLGAAIEYEQTAYDYARYDKSSKAGYASVYAYREYFKNASPAQKNKAQNEVIKASLRFVDVFPGHEKAAIVLSAAADDLYAIKNYKLAIVTAKKYLEIYPQHDATLTRSAWMVVAYASFDLLLYADAEIAYAKVLDVTDNNHPQRAELLDNLAASVYKQGEQALKLENQQAAIDHFLRVGKLAPHSKIRVTAEYDAATVLIKLKNWQQAATVLQAFRKSFPQHKLQSEVTTKLAFVYNENKNFSLAAAEFEKIVKESKDPAIRRESLTTAAELYEKIPDMKNALRVYRQYVQYFPRPIEDALEVYSKIAGVYKDNNKHNDYIKVLRHIIKTDATAGAERNDRTRYLAGMASVAVIEPIFDELVSIKLIKPFKRNLTKKKNKMKQNIQKYNDLVDYKVGHVTAAATYYIAETYYHFSVALLNSERPSNLNDVELEQYNLIIEEEAYPFEEKAINIHKSNLELLNVGVYSSWIDKSLAKLGVLIPGRYAKYEQSTGVLESMLSYRYQQKNAEIAQAGQEIGATPP